MKKIKILICFCLIFCFALCFNIKENSKNISYAEEENRPTFVSVVGFGKCEAVCDMVKINFSLQSICENFAEAQTKSNDDLLNITQKIQEIDKNAKINIIYSSCYPTNSEGIQSFYSINDIVIESECTGCVEKMVEVLQGYQNISFYGVKYSLKNCEEYYKNALLDAKENARQKASSLYQNVELIDLTEVDIFATCQDSQNCNIVIKARVRAKFCVSNEINSSEKTTEQINYLVEEK